MSLQLEQMTKERQKLLAEKVVLTDENKSLGQLLERSENLQDQLGNQIEEMSSQVGVPKSEVDMLKVRMTQRDTEMLTLQVENQSMKKKLELIE